jgi:dTDP-glucose pyrophosphorylase
MPELINTLLERGEKVSAYPVNEGAYIDTGEWKEYKIALKKLSLEE